MSAAVAGRGKGQRENKQKAKPTREPHILIIRSDRPRCERASSIDTKGRAPMTQHESHADGAAPAGNWKPVLGLSDEPATAPLDWREWANKTIAGTVFAQPEPEPLIELTVIVPARDEQDCLAACLESLVSQSEEIFELGKDWELIVVDDHSTDRTADIARGFPSVTLMEARRLEPGWTGKANAIWTAARHARGRWILFTDADTIHEPGDLARHA